jgi:glycerol-3-phosphate dehydrogenase (NAD(P)+)
LGDYETTLFSEFSNNRKYGEELFNGVKFSKLAEGVSTAKAMMVLAEKYSVELPITTAIYNIIYKNHAPLDELLTLFARKNVTEFK